MEKLEIMIKLANERNIDQVRTEHLALCLHAASVCLNATCFQQEQEQGWLAVHTAAAVAIKVAHVVVVMTTKPSCLHIDTIYVESKQQNFGHLQVLLEFKEYATEVDVDFVRRSVRAIGRCAISLERAAERCINVLLELIQTKVNYVVQEAIIVIKDIFRRYPNRSATSAVVHICSYLQTCWSLSRITLPSALLHTSLPARDCRRSAGQCRMTLLQACSFLYTGITDSTALVAGSTAAGELSCVRCRYESIIATLCENLDTLDEPEAKASMIWIIGEYAERIDNADELLEQFLETFPEETSLVSGTPRSCFARQFAY